MGTQSLDNRPLRRVGIEEIACVEKLDQEGLAQGVCSGRKVHWPPSRVKTLVRRM